MKDCQRIPFKNKKSVEVILTDCYQKIKPILKKFKLSLSLLVECEIESPKPAWAKRIKVNFSSPGAKEKSFAYTSMVRIKIRDPTDPQNEKKFLNNTTIFAIIFHELAHIRHMNHGVDFACFLKEIYEYGTQLKIFPENENHMIPSIRIWERKIFETKGQVSKEEISQIFEGLDKETKDKDESPDEI